MAIQFARLQYVKRSAGQSSCHKAAYNGRLEIHDDRLEKTFRYDDKTDSVHHEILLPEGVSEKYRDPAALWNAVEAAEGRWDSQVGKEMVLALPDDASISLEDRIALTNSFVQKHFVKYGIICQVDIHGPAANEGAEEANWHAHVLMPTRPCQGEMFGKKARYLDVDVRGGRVMSNDKQWGRLWAQHQNDYFKGNNIDLQVDPVGLVPNLHLGPVRMRGERAPSLMQRSMMLHEDNRRYAQQEDLVLRHLTSQQATFTKEDVDHFVGKHIDLAAQEDFKQRFYESSQLILVGQSRYTSRAVLDEERKLLRMADRLAHRTADAPFSTAKEIRERVLQVSSSSASGTAFTQAQQQAFDGVIAGSNLTLIEGMAGSGKTHVLGALKDVYQQAGYTVRGFASQAHMVTQMKQDGFAHAANVRRFLFKQYYEREAGFGATDESVWINPGKEVWLVDGATTVANPDMTELLDLAWTSNVKVVLCGDALQKPCQGRGGGFTSLKERYGSLMLDDHSRQQDDAQKQILAAIAQGRADAALDQMEALGTWHHHDKEPLAIKDLLSCWYARYQNAPENSFMILEHRQPYVRVFNEKIHDVLKSRGDVEMNEFSVETAKHGQMKFSAGDALVFMQKDDELGVSTGMRGTLIHVAADCFTVRILSYHSDPQSGSRVNSSQNPERKSLDPGIRQDDNYVKFNPQVYNNFQHGYAGLIYSAEGQTFDHVFALHSKHMDVQDFYVANTRHALSCDYFSSGDKDTVRDTIQSVILDKVRSTADRGPINDIKDGMSEAEIGRSSAIQGNGSSVAELTLRQAAGAFLAEDDTTKSSYLDDCVALICDVFYKDHDYYCSHDYTRAPSYGRDDLQKELVM